MPTGQQAQGFLQGRGNIDGGAFQGFAFHNYIISSKRNSIKRVLHVCAALRKRANRYYAEQCLREALRLLWVEQFGPNVTPPEEMQQWLCQRADVPEKEEAYILRCLLREREQGHEPPAHLAGLVAA